MKLISLNCNHCGAPLDVPEKANFVTCSFCEARLKVECTGTTWSTTVLEEIQQTTKSLAEDVARLKTQSDLQMLDQSWDRERHRYMIKGENNRYSVPSVGAAIAGCIVGVVVLAAFMLKTSQVGGPFAMFGVVGIAIVILNTVRVVNKAEQYRRGRKRYERRRRELMEEPSSTFVPPGYE